MNVLRHQLRLFFIALQFLTRLPVPRWVGYEAPWLAQAARCFALVGALVGAFGAALALAALQLWPPAVAAALALAGTLWLTAALHEDGLADSCDALLGAAPRERALAIMKDSHIGSYGAAALCLSLLLRVLLLAALLARDPRLGAIALVAAHCAGRSAAVALMALLPYAGDAAQAKAAPLAQAQGFTLQVDVGGGVAGFVGGDALRIRQILNNYLNNALRFGGRGGERAQVRLAALRIDAGRVRFEVHDNGAGIDEAAQARLFKPFSQADESTTRRYGGTGLGLSICRELAALMAGQVGVASRLGAGSCFWVELPLAPAAPPPPLPVAAPPAPDALFGASLLVVEDNAVNMLITTTLLRQWGARVDEAGDGAQAVQAVRARAHGGEPFDAVVMDVQMPVMGGHEAARLLRAEFGAEQLPIIALTAAALVSERDEALGAGMNDFLTKPIEAQRLRQVLAHWIGQRRAAPSPHSPPSPSHAASAQRV